MKLPDVPAPGSPLQQSWGRDVVNYLRAITPQSSPTVRVSNAGPNGVSFTAAKPQPPSPPTGIPRPPWWPSVVYDADATQHILTMQTAVINNTPPRVDPEAWQTAIGQEGGKIPLVGTAGLVVCKCEFANGWGDSFSKLTIFATSSGVPADVVPYDLTAAGYIHIVTHIYSSPNSGDPVPTINVRPLYFHSLRVVKYGRRWRW